MGSMLVLSVAVVLALGGVVGLGVVHRRSFARFDRVETALRSLPSALELVGAIDELRERLEDADDRIRNQTLAIAEGIERTDRAERRIRAVVGRAKRRMEDAGLTDPGLDAEAERLRDVDGDSSSSEGMQTVLNGMGARQAPDMSAFPGNWAPFLR